MRPRGRRYTSGYLTSRSRWSPVPTHGSGSRTSGKKKRGRVPKAIVSKIKEIVGASTELYRDEIRLKDATDHSLIISPVHHVLTKTLKY